MSKEYEYWLQCLPEIGSVTIDRLLEKYKSEDKIYEACIKEEEDFIKILKLIRLNDEKIAHVIKQGR